MQNFTKLLPSRLELLRELDKRKALHFQEELQEELLRLEKGLAGEELVHTYLKKYGKKDWVVLRNIWLQYYGSFEIDLLLLTRAGIYVFEVKNYTGKYEFSNNQCLINGKIVGNNAVHQAQKALVNLRGILSSYSNFNRLHLTGLLAFVGEHHCVKLHDEPRDIEVVMRNTLRARIWEILEEERNYQGRSVNVQACKQFFEKIQQTNPLKLNDLSEVTLSSIQPGVCCSRCGNFNVVFKNKRLTCSCGMYEPREETIIRTICEYGVINYEKDLTTRELVDFFDGDVSRTCILGCLKKHFNKIGHNKSTKYINQRLPFSQLRDQFDLTLPRYLRLDHLPYSKE